MARSPWGRGWDAARACGHHESCECLSPRGYHSPSQINPVPAVTPFPRGHPLLSIFVIATSPVRINKRMELNQSAASMTQRPPASVAVAHILLVLAQSHAVMAHI